MFNSAINYESVNAFLEQVNQFYIDGQGNPQQPNFCIYLSSSGGFNEGESVLLNTINDNPQRFKLIANGEISSSAFSLFFNASCDKTIFPGTTGMFHLSRIEVEISQTGKGFFPSDRFHLKNFSKEAKSVLAWCEYIGMTAKEIEKIASTEDQFFTNERLNELLNFERNLDRVAKLAEMQRRLNGINNGHNNIEDENRN